MKEIPLYKFYRHKYGEELLMDVVDYDFMRPWLQKTPVMSYAFYGITLVLEADEIMTVENHSRQLHKEDIFCAIPGEVLHFQPNTKIKALNLIFEREFLLSFFNDPHFLDRFAFLSHTRPTPFLTMEPSLFERITTLYREMQEEIVNYKQKDQHILRAMLYETLMLISRAEFAESSAPSVPETIDTKAFPNTKRYVDKFCTLVADNYKTEHSPQFYADKLCVTQNYLNKIVNRSLGKSCKAYIQEQIFNEARRLLQYTDLTVSEIAQTLNYDTSTYFVRIFTKRLGQTPLDYRRATNSARPTTKG